jgi:hypothetical protein
VSRRVLLLQTVDDQLLDFGARRIDVGLHT